jgi:transcriptional regulator with XRE-family HTH domain
MEAGLSVARQFGENLRRERKRADLSQEEVGFRASLHRTEVGLLERGARVPRIDTLIKLAFVLGVRIDCALLEGISWEPGDRKTRAGSFAISSRVERHRELMERAAKLREGQTETVDAVQLVHEARDELAQRGERWKEEDGEDES